jgi:hypothetical protein
MINGYFHAKAIEKFSLVRAMRPLSFGIRAGVSFINFYDQIV